MGNVSVEAGFGFRTRRPFVAMEATDDEGKVVTLQMHPADAEKIGRDLLVSSSAALADAAVVDMLAHSTSEQMGNEEVALLLTHLRDARTRIDSREGTGGRKAVTVIDTTHRMEALDDAR